jgi:hypothetical protein
MFDLIAKLAGKNLWFIPAKTIVNQMNEDRPLPTGMTEFEEWSDRIISGTLLPADYESQKFALATMLMHLPPTKDHECDGYFIKSLRKAAVNQIAHAKMTELRDKAKERLAAEEAKKEPVKDEANLQLVAHKS